MLMYLVVTTLNSEVATNIDCKVLNWSKKNSSLHVHVIPSFAHLFQIAKIAYSRTRAQSVLLQRKMS